MPAPPRRQPPPPPRLPPPVTALSQVAISMPTHTHTQKPSVLSATQLQAIQQQRLEMRRRLSFSDVVGGTVGARQVKRFLYFWNVVVTLMGLGLLGLGLYLLYFQDNVHIAPTFAYYVATFTGLALALLSVFGLFGLQQQRRCVTEGKRNYPLGAFIVLSTAGTAIMVMGGIVALALLGVVKQAETDDFALERVRVFETAVITNLHAYVLSDRGGWRGIQHSLYCCGYVSTKELSASSAMPWDAALLAMVGTINGVAGKHCAKSASECVAGSELPCPLRGRSWCRDEFYTLMRHNYRLIGVFALVVGAAQLVSSCFAAFTLLCDVRMLPTRSPEVELPQRALAPVAAAAASAPSSNSVRENRSRR